MKRQQNGFTFIEVLAVLSIIAVATVGTLVLRDWAMANSRVSEARQLITTLQSGAQLWRPNTGIYTGINMTELSSIGAIPVSLADGVEKNPWGGNVTIGVDVADLTRYTISLESIPSASEGARLVKEYTETAFSTSFSGNTFTATFQG
ncbi:prepilin-type cleavage/methylation domain-containing protein [Idiomarina tyrosinivorans]|uniref:Prepilin-type cleavage/methylation domain-containing protein n=1 Tax=Idiomarina tyrosinivorans TaxID=1445662 RepID=A0A432ZRB1_9GAMM|nr:prepilin-type N-terminal cleavage/methylation domain-containing protein [Idiomarina tyrosinivorans]RUO80392.1 prepilin-type cleavage/methylation domain-containing protein [Idiomarina tyrosinivorans]